MIRYIYNTQKEPPAPFVRLTLRQPRTGAELSVPAQIDTGADITILPQSVVESLDLDYQGVVEIKGVGGSLQTLIRYSVLASIHDSPQVGLNALAHSEEEWVLLGRDVLNAFRLVLDGPNLALEIS